MHPKRPQYPRQSAQRNPERRGKDLLTVDDGELRPRRRGELTRTMSPALRRHVSWNRRGLGVTVGMVLVVG